MKHSGIAYGVLITMLAGSPALGAQDAFVAEQSSEVLINSGSGWKPVDIIEKVRAGSQVMANGTGRGWIIYCGCDVEILPGSVLTVENRECKVESVNVRQAGLPHLVVMPDGQTGQEEITKCGVGQAWWLLGGAAAAVGICAVAGCFSDSDNTNVILPASP